MKVRKLPVIVDAVYFNGSEESAERLDLDVCKSTTDGDDRKYSIKTLEGRMEVKSGSWIITGVEGERYACDDAIFMQTYEGICPQCSNAFSFERTTTKQRIGDLWCCSQKCVLEYMNRPVTRSHKPDLNIFKNVDPKAEIVEVNEPPENVKEDVDEQSDGSCLGCREKSVYHTCGKEPSTTHEEKPVTHVKVLCPECGSRALRIECESCSWCNIEEENEEWCQCDNQIPSNICQHCGKERQSRKYPFKCIMCGGHFTSYHQDVTDSVEQGGLKAKELFCCPGCEDRYYNKGYIKPNHDTLRRAMNIISEACDKYVFGRDFGEELTGLLKGQPCDDKTRHAVREIVFNRFRKTADINKINFEVVSNASDTINIKPKNLYTAVALYSGNVGEDIDHEEGDYRLSDGTIISYSEKYGAVIRPVTPLEYIKVGFKIIGDEIPPPTA
ncbi:MAG: hypothetical protein GF411_02830 [Candidatus Lokiarchaeota archaeon]|nr:hypothetical protein [Candidatus Lokiarchaeota archaeon]